MDDQKLNREGGVTQRPKARQLRFSLRLMFLLIALVSVFAAYERINKDYHRVERNALRAELEDKIERKKRELEDGEHIGIGALRNPQAVAEIANLQKQLDGLNAK